MVRESGLTESSRTGAAKHGWANRGLGMWPPDARREKCPGNLKEVVTSWLEVAPASRIYLKGFPRSLALGGD